MLPSKFLLVSLAVALITACQPAATPTPTAFTFGMVLVGPNNDHGWSEAHFTAGQYVEKTVTGAKMVWLDKLNPADRKGVTLDSVVADLIAKGAKVVFTTSDDFLDDTRLAAEKYQGTTFIHVSGDDVLKGKAPKNEGNVMGKMEYGKMIAGCAAAMATSTGKLAYLGPLINGETRRLAASAYLGAKHCWEKYRGKSAKDLKFDVRWIGFWFNIPGVTLDPTKVATDFYNANFDVVMSGIDTTEALVEANKRAQRGEKVLAVPYDFKGACEQAPNVCLGVPYFNWGPAYAKIVKDVRAGSWKQAWDWNSPDWKDINNPDTSHVGFLAGPALKPEPKAKVDEFVKGLADGSITLFKGPLKFQDGSVYLKDGEVATDRQIWYLAQLLEGMTGPSAAAK